MAEEDVEGVSLERVGAFAEIFINVEALCVIAAYLREKICLNPKSPALKFEAGTLV